MSKHALDNGLKLITVERCRQVYAEGWTPEHDDEHQEGALAQAAAVYAAPQGTRARARYPAAIFGEAPTMWPWDDSWWKPTPGDRIRELVKAGALIAAEIDRLLRAGAKTELPEPEQRFEAPSETQARERLLAAADVASKTQLPEMATAQADVEWCAIGGRR